MHLLKTKNANIKTENRHNNSKHNTMSREKFHKICRWRSQTPSRKKYPSILAQFPAKCWADLKPHLSEPPHPVWILWTKILCLDYWQKKNTASFKKKFFLTNRSHSLSTKKKLNLLEKSISFYWKKLTKEKW